MATLWNNRIKSFSDVFCRINLSCVYKHDDEKKAILYARLFLLRLYRWIKGQGHPRELVGSLVSEDYDQKSKGSPRTMRAKLFWKAMTDLVTLPPNVSKDIRVGTSSSPSYVR